MFWKTTLLGLTLSAAMTSGRVVPPDVPANLVVPEGNKLFAITHAEGTQNYVCLPNGGTFTWVHHGPQAALFDSRGAQVMTHFLSANPDENGALRAAWQDSRDTSAVWAMAIESSTDPEYVSSGAVPWLLLRVVGAEFGPQWGDRLTKTTFIQRVNTAGGVAPATGCSGTGDVGNRALVPYSTDYLFYR